MSYSYNNHQSTQLSCVKQDKRKTYFLRVIESFIHFIYDSPQIITLYYGCKQKQFTSQQCLKTTASQIANQGHGLQQLMIRLQFYFFKEILLCPQ